MKKQILVISIALLFISSCHDSTYAPLIGHWIFKTVAYNAGTDIHTGNTLIASNSVDTAQVQLTFSTYPATAGTYKIVSPADTSAGDHVSIALTAAGGIVRYVSTGHDGTVATISISTFSQVSVSIPAAELVNTALSSDSAPVTYLFINQQ